MAIRSVEKAYSKLAAVACGLAIVAFAATGQSQTTTPAPAPPVGGMTGGMNGGMGGPMGGGMVRFVGFEGNMGGQVVTGAPYSATLTSEFMQTLSDGTVIDRKTTGMIARDGMGRTRRETTLPAIGPFATSGTPPTMISIDDPVAQKHYMLNPADKTAREMGPGPKMGGFGGVREAGRNGDGGRGFAMRVPGGHDGGPDGGSHDGGPKMPGGDQAVTVSLGTKTVQGVMVEGTRTTRTIPAGMMGNQQAIVISFEKWYSPDLLTNVMTVRSDPFTGKTTFMLTNLKRGEPDASLFQVPADYKMIMGGPGRNMMYGHKGDGQMGPGAHMRRGPGGADGSGGGPNSNQAPPPPPAMPPGQGQDN